EGRYANIPISYNEATKTLTIGERKGEFPGMLKTRTFTIVTCSKDKPQGYNPDAAGQEVKYEGKAVSVKI
ncbi:MAG: DUF5110 domain-containing protein, partial [Bacteroidaceae bacterium]|nr:DUF5110 domain-containing protein [Bacteroidaceae bacterium]